MGVDHISCMTIYSTKEMHRGCNEVPCMMKVKCRS